MTETAIMPGLRLTASRAGFALWRNNSGAFRDGTGRWIRYGLGNDSATLCRDWKSSDLVGVGPAGRFLAVEVKPPDWRYRGTPREAAQLSFLRNVVQLGGIAGFVRSDDELLALLGCGR